MTRLWRTWAQLRGRDRTTERQQLVMDYRQVFGSEAGRRVLGDILQSVGVMQTSFGPDGAAAVAFREGRRRVGLEIIQTINVNPDAIQAAVVTGELEELFQNGNE